MVRNSTWVYGSQSTTAVKLWSPDQQHLLCLGTCWKCRWSGLTPDLLSLLLRARELVCMCASMCVWACVVCVSISVCVCMCGGWGGGVSTLFSQFLLVSSLVSLNPTCLSSTFPICLIARVTLTLTLLLPRRTSSTYNSVPRLTENHSYPRSFSLFIWEPFGCVVK